METGYKLARFTLILLTILLALGSTGAASTAVETTISVWPAYSSTCESGKIAVRVLDGVDLVGYELFLSFTPGIINITSIENGGFIYGDLASFANGFDNTSGTASFGYVHYPMHGPVTGSGNLIIINFDVVQTESVVAFIIDPVNSDLVDSSYIPDVVSFGVVNGTLSTSCQPPHSVYLPLILR